MKTAIKIVALSAALIAAVVSCTDISVSSRDWKAIERGNDTDSFFGKDPGDIVAANRKYLPRFTPDSFNGAGANITEKDRELTITFPQGADIAKSDNDDIIDDLQKFLTFFHYTLAADSANNEWKPDTKGAEVGYTFVRRDTNNSVVVRFDKIQAISPLIAKIDGTKYTFGSGLKLDLNGDGEAGEEIYDDAYYAIGMGSAIEAHKYVPAGGELAWTTGTGFGEGWGTYQNWTLDINTYAPDISSIVPTDIFQNGFTVMPENPGAAYPLLLKIAEINLDNEKLGNAGSGANNNNDQIKKVENEILNMVKEKFKLQKYDGDGKWSDVPGGEAKLVQRDAATPAGNGDPAGTNDGKNGYLYIALTPKNKEIYRIRVEEITSLVTGSYVGAEQIVALNMPDRPAFPRGKGNNFTSHYQGFHTVHDVTYFTSGTTSDHDGTKWSTAAVGLFSSLGNSIFVNYEPRERNNVIIDLEVPEFVVGIGNSTTYTVLPLKTIASVDDFNKGFKLVYIPNNGTGYIHEAIPSLNASDIAFMDVADVKLEKKEAKNYLKLTLDPKYQYRSGDTFTVLLSPRFNGFGEPKVILGNPANIDIIIKVDGDNIDCWDMYGTITMP